MIEFIDDFDIMKVVLNLYNPFTSTLFVSIPLWKVKMTKDKQLFLDAIDNHVSNLLEKDIEYIKDKTNEEEIEKQLQQMYYCPKCDSKEEVKDA